MINPHGKPTGILDIVAEGKLRVYYSFEILAEYMAVLGRAHFRFDVGRRNSFIDSVRQFGLLVHPQPGTISLPDEDDRCFYDAAVLCGCRLITGNAGHYPPEPTIVSSAEFLQAPAQKPR